MALYVETKKDCYCCTAITDPTKRHECVIRSRSHIPQQVRDCPIQAKIYISEKSQHYIVVSELPGVTLMNLWVFFEEKNLSIYAGVTGEKQDGDYLYTDKLLGGIRGEIILPIQVRQRPEIVEFVGDVLFIAIPKPKEIDEFLEQMVII